MEKIAGHLEVGTTGEGEVVVNHPELQPNPKGEGHLVFSPSQARALAATLNQKADTADQEIDEHLIGTAMTNKQIARLIRADYHLFMHSGTLGKDRILAAITDALDTYDNNKGRQENVDNMRRVLDAFGQDGRAVEEIVDAVIHAPYLAAIAGLRAQIDKLNREITLALRTR